MKITQFANPELLWLLVLLLPMAALYVWRVRRGGSALRISSVVPLEGVSRGVRYWARHLPFVLRCTAVALLVVALARPQNSEKGSSTTTEGIDIVLAMDVSTSMLARDFEPDRITAAKDVAAKFVADRPNDRIGIVGHNGGRTQGVASQVTVQNCYSTGAIEKYGTSTNAGYALVGGGTVKLTVTTNAPKKVVPTCEGVTITENSDGTFSALLPNETKTYTFTATYAGDNNHASAEKTCTVSVTAYYVPGAPTYPATAPAAPNGTVTVSPANASKGATVTVTVKPNEGYELGSLAVKDASGDLLPLADLGNGKFGFVMPASKVSVEANFVKSAVSTGFADVPANAFFADAVKWAVDKGVTNGLTDTMFGPYEPCTRGQIITFLWRAAGSPEPKTAVSFADVPAGSYYAKAVAWAIENGITNGMTETTFAPDATCTRGQGVTFLYRALKGSAGATSSFVDVPANAFYADAVGWAVSGKVTDGTSNTTFSPDDNCTRGQIVTFLYRAYQGK